MRTPRRLFWLPAGALLAVSVSLAAADKILPEENADPDLNPTIKDSDTDTVENQDKNQDKKQDKKPGKNDIQKNSRDKQPTRAKAVAKWIADLKDPDPQVRQAACQMLAILTPPEAVPPLIDVLRPELKEPLLVLLTAHGALAKITGKNFGYKAYDQWLAWWAKNKEDFMMHVVGVDDKSKDVAKSWNTMGIQLMNMGEFRQAQARFLQAVTFDPTTPDFRNNLGLSLLEQGRYLDAMTTFEEVIGIDPNLPQPYMNIGRCYSSMDKTIEAHVWFKKASEHDKDGRLWDLDWAIGKEYMKHGDYKMAREYLDKARNKMEKLNLHDARLHNDLAITHYGLDQYHSAYKELMNVRTLGCDPNPDFLAKVRQALKAQGIDPDEEDKKARDAQRKEAQEQAEK